MTIGRKLAIGFSVLIFLVLLGSVSFFYTVRRINANVIKLAEVEHRLEELVLEMEISLSETVRRTLSYTQMPEMDGFEATAAIREREAHGARMPIVALTAHAMTGDRERCLEAGMDAYLSKPLDITKLTEVLDKAASSQPPVLDRTSAMARVDGDAALLGKITELYVSIAPGMMTDIGQAVRIGDANALERASHALKGCVSNFGAQRAGKVALHLENIGRSGDLGDAKPVLARLETEIAWFTEELTGFQEEATHASTHR